MNISIPESSKYSLLEDAGKLNGKGITSAISAGRKLKVTVDNIDGRIIANQVYRFSLETILVNGKTKVAYE